MVEWIALGLAVAGLILRFVAPKTKTKVDDVASEVVDLATKTIPTLPISSARPQGTVNAPGTGPTAPVSRDHRSK